MKFIHLADMHFDSSFSNLSDNKILGNKKRLEQREVFKNIIEYIKENDIPYLFISGDLYENEHIQETTIEYINKLFMQIPKTKIFISPGNHDPFTKNSYYNTYNWASNVKIFGPKIEKVTLDEINIYGYGFDDFYCTNSKIEELEIENKDKLNILIIHGTLDGANIEEKQYNSMNRAMLESKGFNYIALGHIHKADYNSTKDQYIIYPGSTISMGFDELGEHGVIYGELTKDNIKLEFIPMSKLNFEEIKLDCSEYGSKEDLIEDIKDLEINKDNLYKIMLTGKRRFEIDTYNLYNYDLSENIIKIKNKTKMDYDLEKISNERTLRGLFAKEMLKKIKEAKTQEELEIIDNAIEIGMEVVN